MKSQIDYLSEALDQIKQGMFELIDNSRILRFKNDPSSDVVFISPEFYWDGPTAKEQQIQIELRRKYLEWIEIFKMIIENAPDNVKSKMSEIDSFILNWIDKGIEWGLPGTLQEAKTRFEEAINPLFDTLKLYRNTENGSIILPFQFSKPDDTREAFFIPNMGAGIGIVSSSGWLDNIYLQKVKKEMAITAGNATALVIRMPKVCSGVATDGVLLKKTSSFNQEGYDFYELNIDAPESIIVYWK